MKIDSRPFGEIEINDDDIISFPEGIFGFEGLKSYVLLESSNKGAFYWLQSVESHELAFLVINIRTLLTDYRPLVSTEHLSLIKCEDLQNAEMWGIVTIPEGAPENMTINLQGPLLINVAENLGGQFISDDETHSVRVPVLALLDEGEG